MTQWFIGVFVRFSSSKDDLMKETKFPLSATVNSLPDCWSYAGVGRLKRFGEPFQLFNQSEFFPTPFCEKMTNPEKSLKKILTKKLLIDILVKYSIAGMAELADAQD